MIGRAGSGWQTILADLSLILFMVAASALPSTDPSGSRSTETPAAPSEQAEPLAVWREAPGMVPIGQWIAEQSPDPRQQLTILAQYGEGGQATALARVQDLARQAGLAGASVRIIVEPGSQGVVAELAYDVPDATVARELLDESTRPDHAKEVP